MVAAVAIASLLLVGCVQPAPTAPVANVTVGGQDVVVRGPVGSRLTVAPASGAPTAPAGLSFPFGALRVDVAGIAAGSVARVTVTLPAPVTTVRKLVGGGWQPFDFDGTTGATVSADGKIVTLLLRDGGRGDSDGSADGTVRDPVAPAVEQAPPVTATQVVTGPQFSCALLSTGKVRCWGQNQQRILGRDGPDSAIPVEISGVDGAIQIAAGSTHVCALIDDGTVRCWGNNGWGQLGDGSEPTLSGGTVSGPVTVEGLSDVVEVAAGSLVSCARLADGTVRCWGYGDAGTLGDGSTQTTSLPVTVTGVTGATRLSVGGGLGCVIDAGGTRCWGNNFNGNLGNGTLESAPVTVPTAIPGLATATQIAPNDYHSCARLADGTVSCWGGAAFGALGNGVPVFTEVSPTAVAVPTAVGGLGGVDQVATGYFNSCALSTGSVSCWGYNDEDNLGIGADVHTGRPEPVDGLSGVTEIAMSDTHVCALLTDGTVQCWGGNDRGAVGDGTFNPTVPNPTPVVGVT